MSSFAGTSHSLDLSRFPLAVAFAAVSIALSYFMRDLRAGYLAVGIVLNFAIYLFAWNRAFRPSLSYVDPSIIFLAVVVLYSIIPLGTLEAMNFRLASLQDNRLNHIVLDDAIISTTVLNANGILIGFGTAYLMFRLPRMPETPAVSVKVTRALWILLVVALLVRLGMTFASAGAQDYGDEYLLIQSLPLLVIQILNICSSLLYVTIFGLFFTYMAQGKLKAVLFLLVLSLSVFAFSTQARTPLMLVVIAVVVCWDHLYSRLSPVHIALALLLVVVGFLARGASRAGDSTIAAAFAQSEFMAVFVTSLDVRQIYLTGSSADTGLTLLLADLARLIPQQIAPFQKIDPASWYLTTYYPQYAASGGGFAFGMLAEAALSGGFWMAILRGFTLASVICLALSTIIRRQSFFAYITYIWLLACIYQSFRDTTFTLFGRFTFQLLPAILLCVLLSRFLPDTPRDSDGRA